MLEEQIEKLNTNNYGQYTQLQKKSENDDSKIVYLKTKIIQLKSDKANKRTLQENIDLLKSQNEECENELNEKNTLVFYLNAQLDERIMEVEKLSKNLGMTKKRYNMYLILGFSALFLLNILISICIFCCCRRKNEEEVVETDSNSTSSEEEEFEIRSTISSGLLSMLEKIENDEKSIERSRPIDSKSPDPILVNPHSRILSKSKKQFLREKETNWKIEKYLQALKDETTEATSNTTQTCFGSLRSDTTLSSFGTGSTTPSIQI